MPRIFYGWWIVAAGGVVQAYTSAVFWRGFTAFFTPIVDTFGWSSGATAAATSLQRTEGGLISPFVGTILNRYGPRKVMAFGVTVTGGSFIFMSQVQSLWQFYLAMSMLTVGMSFGTFIVLVATVGNWFVRKRARALATLMTCSSIGGITVPLLVWIIAAYGWREVLFSVGIGFWLVGFPAVFVMRTRPEDYGQLPDGVDPDAAGEGGRSRVTREPAFGVRAVLKTRFFWQFSVAASLSQLVSSTNLLYLPALNNFHVNLALAAAVISGVAIGDFIGRVSVGIVGDKYDNRLLIAASFGLQTIGVLALAATNASIGGYTITSAITLPIFAVGAGIGFGSSIPLRLAMLADYFGRRSFGSVVGVTSMVSAVFGAIGPIFAGVMFDLTDTYRPPFLIMAGLLIWAVPMTLTLEAPGRVAAKARLASRNRR